MLLLADPEVDLRQSEMTNRLANSPGDRTGAFQLVYRSYLRAGLVSENPWGMRVTPYQLCPTSQQFVAVVRCEVVSTVTLVGDGSLGLPMESMFPDEVNEFRSAGRQVAEVSCLADRRANPSRFLETFCQLTRLMAQYARYQGIECLLITVHPKHARFYRRYLGFQPISDRIANCPHAQDRPAVALKLDFNYVDVERPECWEDFFGQLMTREELAPYSIPSNELQLLTEIAQWCREKSEQAVPSDCAAARGSRH